VKTFSQFLSITLLICSLSAFADASSSFEFCEQELTKEIEKLLNDDGQNILGEAFNLASYKLAYNMQKDEGENKTLEQYIKEKAKYIKGKDKQNLIKRVSELYQKFGLGDDLKEITQTIDGLKDHNYFPAAQRLSNKEHSVILLAFKEMQPCSKVCITEDDAAVTWFMDEISTKVKSVEKNSAKTNLLQMSVKVAHLNGALGNGNKTSLLDLKKQIQITDNKVKGSIEQVKRRFFEQFNECKDLLTNKCFQKVVKDILPATLKKILESVNVDSIKGIDSKLKVKLTESISLNLKNSLFIPKTKSKQRYPTKLNIPSVVVNSEKGPLMCGGEDFKPAIKDIKLWSFDPLKALAVKNNYGKAGKLPGSQIGMLCELLKLGPIQFHCTPWLKKFVLRKKDAKAKVCCNEKEKWEEFTNLFASISGGLDLKAYLGVPFLSKVGVNGEVGIIGGFSAAFSIGGGEVPEGCITKNCLQAAVRTSVFLGGYLDVGVRRKVNSAIGGEFKVAWKPYLTSRQCLYPQNHLPPMEVKYSIGSIWLHGTIYAGWVLNYDFYEPIYKNNDEDSLSIPIF
jgi:phenylpyruvate tautomerase PptA (4-oxalocrotonate tautomerase family)